MTYSGFWSVNKYPVCGNSVTSKQELKMTLTKIYGENTGNKKLSVEHTLTT